MRRLLTATMVIGTVVSGAVVSEVRRSTALSSATRAGDAWAVLAEARRDFEVAPWTADFVQTYVPAGFATGDRETGRVSISLPDSLRWDYEVPYPKVFLVSGETAFSWNEGESAGRRVPLGPDDRRHLELLQLDLDGLRRSFSAVLEPEALPEAKEGGEDGTLVVALSPLDDESPIRSATLRFHPTSLRLTALSWSDLEGNVTEFVLSGHRIVADESFFEPPAELYWFDE